MRAQKVQDRFAICEKILKLCILSSVVFTLTGCGEQTVKVIFVPVAAAGGGGWLLWFYIAAGISSVVDPYTPPTPEQVQQHNAAIQEQEERKRRTEAMDLPEGLTPTSSNFAYANAIIDTAIVVESPTLSPNHAFRVYSKDTSYQNTQWRSSAVYNVELQNADNPSRRLFFNLKNPVAGSKIVVTWDEANVPENACQPDNELNLNQSNAEDTRQNTQHPNNKSNPDYFDPSGL